MPGLVARPALNLPKIIIIFSKSYLVTLIRVRRVVVIRIGAFLLVVIVTITITITNIHLHPLLPLPFPPLHSSPFGEDWVSAGDTARPEKQKQPSLECSSFLVALNSSFLSPPRAPSRPIPRPTDHPSFPRPTDFPLAIAAVRGLHLHPSPALLPASSHTKLPKCV